MPPHKLLQTNTYGPYQTSILLITADVKVLMKPAYVLDSPLLSNNTTYRYR